MNKTFYSVFIVKMQQLNISLMAYKKTTEFSVAFFTKVSFGFGNDVIRILGVILLQKRLGYGVY